MQFVIELQVARISPLPFALGRDGSEFGVILSLSIKAVDRSSDARISLTMSSQVAVAACAGVVFGSRELSVSAAMVAVTIGARGNIRRDLRLMMDRPRVTLQALGIAALGRSLVP
jgi:hypothetical protein